MEQGKYGQSLLYKLRNCVTFWPLIAIFRGAKREAGAFIGHSRKTLRNLAEANTHVLAGENTIQTATGDRNIYMSAYEGHLRVICAVC